MTREEVDQLLREIGTIVRDAVRVQFEAKAAEVSEAIAGLISGQAVLISVLDRAGVLQASEVRAELDRAERALPEKERRGKGGEVLRKLASMTARVEGISFQ